MARTRITSDFTDDSVPRFRVDSEGGDTDMVLGAVPVKIINFKVKNLTGTAGFVQIHDAIALPNNGAVPLWVLDLPANGFCGDDIPLDCFTGAVMAISTTASTLTISTNNAIMVATVENTTR
jgi:hypothetical protein